MPSPSPWGSGIALGDVDGDGDVDVVGGEWERPFLLRAGSDGSFREENPFVDSPPGSIAGVTLVDEDADGDLDLFVTTQLPDPGAQLWRNLGNGRFEDHSYRLPELEGEQLGGPSWGDFDLDGDLDVFVPAYGGERSYLLRNDGTEYVDVAAEFGVDDPDAASLQGLFVDIDIDGDVDLIVANDKGRPTNRTTVLFRNDGGILRQVDVGFVHEINGMGLAIGDVDGDEDLDLYVSDIGYSDDGQKLYLQQGDGTFLEAAREWGVSADGHYGWGTEFIDFDNDGDLDLALADTFADAPFVAENHGDWFVAIDPVINTPSEPSVGFASADFDRDGRTDVVWWLDDSPSPNVVRVMRNAVRFAGNYLQIELQGRAPNTRGIGATVFLQADGRRQLRPIVAGGSFFSSSDATVHFGLGPAVVAEVEVLWPNGMRTMHGPFAANQRIQIVE